MLHTPLFIICYLPHVSVPLEPSSGRYMWEHVIELNERKLVADILIIKPMRCTNFSNLF